MEESWWYNSRNEKLSSLTHKQWPRTEIETKFVKTNPLWCISLNKAAQLHQTGPPTGDHMFLCLRICKIFLIQITMFFFLTKPFLVNVYSLKLFQYLTVAEFQVLQSSNLSTCSWFLSSRIKGKSIYNSFFSI